MLSLALSGRGEWGKGRGWQGECSPGFFAPSGACVQTMSRRNGSLLTLYLLFGTCVQTMSRCSGSLPMLYMPLAACV